MSRIAHIVARRALPALLAAAVGCATLTGDARADGDPASDVLVSQRAFVAADAGATQAEQVRLQRLLETAAARGYPIRVALIGSASDLGSVTALWRHPQRYAQFLGQELSFAVHGPVLVVMPNGVGLSTGVPLRTGERNTLTGTRTAVERSVGLATIATETVAKLASAAGHPLPASVLSAPAAPRAGSGSDVAAWVVFGVGAAAIAVAWALSLHRRPLRRRRIDEAPSA